MLLSGFTTLVQPRRREETSSCRLLKHGISGTVYGSIYLRAGRKIEPPVLDAALVMEKSLPIVTVPRREIRSLSKRRLSWSPLISRSVARHGTEGKLRLLRCSNLTAAGGMSAPVVHDPAKCGRLIDQAGVLRVAQVLCHIHMLRVYPSMLADDK